MNPWRRYTRWLHTQWPAGHVEKLPVVAEDGSTNVSGLFVVGDLRGIPLLKFSADTGARAVQRIVADGAFAAERASKVDGVLDVAIVGGGVAGMAAALEARKQGLAFAVIEATEPFSTIVNFPKGKPIYTYPKDMTPAGDLQVTADVKEALVDELRRQTVRAGIEPRIGRAESVRRSGGVFVVKMADGDDVRALRAVVALGRSGSFRKLGVPGEDLDKVYNRLHDPMDYAGQKALVVGGGDSALETAIALALGGADVTISYRKPEFARPKPENAEKLQRLADDPSAEGVAVEDPSSERVTTSAGAFLEPGHARGSIRLRMESEVREIRANEVVLAAKDGVTEVVANEVVFTMIGREPPLEFFRRSRVAILGEWSAQHVATLVAFFAFVTFVYHWKAGGALTAWFQERSWFPFGVERAADPSSLAGTIAISATTPAFWFTLLYSLAIVVFGFLRIRRRRTPYVTVQTWTLMLVQVVPLFLLPNLLLPWAGYRGAFGERHAVVAIPEAAARFLEAETSAWTEGEEHAWPLDGAALPALAGFASGIAQRSWGDRLLLRAGDDSADSSRTATIRLADGRAHVVDASKAGSRVADQLFPATEWDPHGREYWRAFGFILAWPLFLWNFFTDAPLTLWLIIGFVQTFVAIPIIVYFWGKGAYCGWICSCGGLAETLGDTHRHKMPHGPFWNRLNLVGQWILIAALVLGAVRVITWIVPVPALENLYMSALQGKTASWQSLPFPFTHANYKWFVDLFLAGMLGTGLYFHFSGRVWCRFACPLAALMHVYARLGRFRILADKKKCISCNVCTSVCHQGIDVMNFANKGIPMADPQCVRCSACVQSCPTGVLSFGQVDRAGKPISRDRLQASPVQMREGI